MLDNKKATFIALCLRGEASLDEIDDFIDAWHDSSRTSTLHDYLGMSWEEYTTWVKDPNSLYLLYKKKIKSDNKKNKVIAKE